MRYRLAYSARILALILTTLLGAAFVICCVVLVRMFTEIPSIIMREDVIEPAVVGLAFICVASVICFLGPQDFAKALLTLNLWAFNYF